MTRLGKWILHATVLFPEPLAVSCFPNFVIRSGGLKHYKLSRIGEHIREGPGEYHGINELTKKATPRGMAFLVRIYS